MAKQKSEYSIIKVSPRRDQIEPQTVDVGVNGVGIRLQRNQLIPVENSVIEVLKNAEMPEYVLNEDTKQMDCTGMKTQYPYEVIGSIDLATYNELREVAKTRPLTPEEVYKRLL